MYKVVDREMETVVPRWLEAEGTDFYEQGRAQLVPWSDTLCISIVAGTVCVWKSGDALVQLKRELFLFNVEVKNLKYMYWILTDAQKI